MGPPFHVGDKVFVKMRGYPPWPSRIEKVLEEENKTLYKVYFYGTEDTRVVKEKYITLFNSAKDKLGQRKNSKFSYAMAQIEKELASESINALNNKKKIQDVSQITKESTVFQSSNVSTAVESPRSECVRGNIIENIEMDEEKVNVSFQIKRPKFINSNNCLTKVETLTRIYSLWLEEQIQKDEPLHTQKLMEELNKHDHTRIEKILVETNFKIINSVGIKKPKLKECLKHLNYLYCLNITASMLEKHPQVIDTVDKLRNYFGNIELSKITKEQECSFEEEATAIREKSKEVYSKFESLFSNENSAEEKN